MTVGAVMLFEEESQAQATPAVALAGDGGNRKDPDLRARLEAAEKRLRAMVWNTAQEGDVSLARILGQATGLSLSARNSLLAGIQAPGALMLRGQKGWRALGVEVPSTAEGAVILAPDGQGGYRPTLVYSDQEVGFRPEPFPTPFLLPSLAPWVKEEDAEEEGEDLALLRAATRFLAARLPKGFLPWEEGRRATLWLGALGAETLLRRRGVVPNLPQEIWAGAFGGRPNALKDALFWAHGAIRSLAQRMGLDG